MPATLGGPLFGHAARRRGDGAGPNHGEPARADRARQSDAKTKVPKGHLYAWGQNVVAAPAGPITTDSTFCFDEFVIWQLPSGEIHTVSSRGPCGTYLDKTLVPPVANPDATVVAGGGQGVIVSGTNGFKNWSGTRHAGLRRGSGSSAVLLLRLFVRQHHGFEQAGRVTGDGQTGRPRRCASVR